ncbi:MerR family transcriptional regulator [Methylobacterium oxalidis]|uniref:MerR family transcriptional regulator n=1 Tax=Methylobacterium oxalidis TaxID=944322 RepID=UPI003315C28A
MTREEFCLTLGIEQTTLQFWLEEGWFGSSSAGEAAMLSEVDVARARLIRQLLGQMGVNAQGVGIILDLVDQVHGFRSALRRTSAAYAASFDNGGDGNA